MSRLDDLRDLASPPKPTPPGPLEMPERARREPKPMRRAAKVKPVNRERRALRRAAQFGDCSRMARLLPCALCGAAPPSDPAHVLSRGAGGLDEGNVYPACRRHHDLQHALGVKAFEKRYQVSLEVIASAVLDAVRAHACTSWRRPNKKTKASECAVCLAPLEDA